MEGWSDFFVASAGCAGALVGLAFVAISINLARIIELPGVVGRAAETIILLSGTMASSLIALMPHLSSQQLGISLLVATGLTWASTVTIQVLSLVTNTYYKVSHATLRAVLVQLATLPGICTSLALLGITPGNTSLLALGAILSILVAMFNAWVLLIEILR